MLEISNKLKTILEEKYNFTENFMLFDAKPWEWHFSFKESLKMSKIVWKNPLELCEEIKSFFWEMDKVDKIEIYKPWFINFFLSNKWILELLKNEEIVKKNEKILVEYWNENIAKEMSVGHLRSNIIWKSLINLFKFLKYEVVSVNHLWDYGTQFWKLIVAFEKWGNEKDLEKNPIKYLNEIYVKFHEEMKNNESLEVLAREKFVELEKEFWQLFIKIFSWKFLNDKNFLKYSSFKELEYFFKMKMFNPKSLDENSDDLDNFFKIASDEKYKNILLWLKFREFSLKEFLEKYELLGSKFDYFLWESFYLPFLNDLIWEIDKSIWEKWEKWAKIVSFWEKAPLMYQKSDWASTYATRDLTAIKFRTNVFKADKILYCVWNEQSQHFQQVFEVAKKVWFSKSADLIHIKNWLFSLPEWKISTRKWNVIKLSELFDESFKRAKKILEEKEYYKKLSNEEQNILMKNIAIWAIKFNDLSQDRERNIVFSFDKAISFEGMSGPYMQYSFARTCGILRKAWEQKVLYKDLKENFFTNEKEKELAFFLWKFHKVLEISAKNYKIHHLARYIYELSQVFNSFYAENRVLDVESENSKQIRIFLVQKTSETISKGLEILGIKALERM